jgi:hypothetical protein
MSRKIKIQTVDKTKSTELENTLKENICTKTNEKALDAPDVIEKARKIMDKLREEDNNPCNDNTGDASAYTNNELDTYDYYVMAEEYINKIILPLFIKADSENANNIASMKLVNFQSMLVSLFKEHNIMSLDDAINNKKLYDIVIADLIVFNFNEPLVNPEKLIHVLVDDHLGQFKSNYDKIESAIEKNNSIKDQSKNNEICRIKINDDNKKITKNNLPQDLIKSKAIADKIIEHKNINNNNVDNEEISFAEIKNFVDKVRGNYDKYYGVDNQVGELVLSIPEENMDTLTKTEPENKPCNMVENSTTYEEVNHPDHYNVYDVEVVEMMERIFGIEETMSWCKLNAFKYRMRAGEKPTSTVEKDLKKEKWCLNKYKELKSKK